MVISVTLFFKPHRKERHRSIRALFELDRENSLSLSSVNATTTTPESPLTHHLPSLLHPIERRERSCRASGALHQAQGRQPRAFPWAGSVGAGSVGAGSSGRVLSGRLPSGRVPSERLPSGWGAGGHESLFKPTMNATTISAKGTIRNHQY